MTDTTEMSELEVLKERATDMGIKFSPNIGLDTLREKVNAKLAPAHEEAMAGKGSSHNDLIAEATKLIRVRITNLNPNKKHSQGEFMRTGNRVVKTIARFVPFEVETHVENMLLTLMKSRQYAVVTEEKNADGKKVPVRKMRKEFQIEVLDQLTRKELDDLAAAQSKRQSV